MLVLVHKQIKEDMDCLVQGGLNKHNFFSLIEHKGQDLKNKNNNMTFYPF